MRRYLVLILAVAAAVTVPAAQAGRQARSSSGSADLLVQVLATTAATIDPSAISQVTILNGSSRPVYALTFSLGVSVFNIGPDPEPSTTYGLDLPPGLHWAASQADTDCPLTASTASCQTTGPDGKGLPFETGVFDNWLVTADAPGTYLIKVHGSGSLPDPNTANNESTASVIVQEQVLTKPLKVSPARPKAGSVVSVRIVGITAGGDPVTPTALRCSGSIAGKTLAGTAQAALGKATCAYRTPRSAKGKRLRGVISFTASHTQLTKRFAIGLR